jgi:hypothetical protein
VKIHRSAKCVYIDLSIAEARVLLDELSHVRGGSKLQKIKQVCEGLEDSIALVVVDPPEKQERAKTPCVLCRSNALSHRCPHTQTRVEGVAE